MSKLSFFLLCILLVGISARPQPKRDRNDYSKKPYRVVCYFGSWANYHMIDPFKVEDIDTNLCTHVNYAFAKLNEKNYEIEASDPYLDDKKDVKNLRGYERFNNLRQKNPNLTTMISLGGITEYFDKYTMLAKNPDMRKGFVQSVLRFLKMHDFDGLDIDWEFPSSSSSDPSTVMDKHVFITLLRELRVAFEPEGYVLTAAVSATKNTIDSAYIVPELNKLLDWMNIMSYDYHNKEHFLAHNAPLYNRPEETDDLSTLLTVNYTINYWLSLGADKKNLVMGMAFFGRAWTLTSQTKVKPHDMARGVSPPGLISREEGMLGYNEICQLEQKSPDQWVYTYDPYYRAPYAHNKEIWVGFDDRQSLSCKLAYLKKMGLSGGMVWSIEFDDFKNRCHGGKNPLLHKVHGMLNGAERHSSGCQM